MKVEAMVLRFSKPSSSALTSPSAGDRAQGSARPSCPQSPPWPPSAALTRQKGWGKAEASGQASGCVPASLAPPGWLGAAGLVRQRLGQVQQAPGHLIPQPQGQSVAEAEPSSDPEHPALGALGWQRADRAHTCAQGWGLATPEVGAWPLWRVQGHLGLTVVVGQPVSGGLGWAPWPVRTSPGGR